VFIHHQQATNENLVLPPKVIKDLARELKNLDESPPEDIAVFVNEDNFSNITADIEGPRRLASASLISVVMVLLIQD
jgi:ubiquitin-conjugating enzyme E2 S